MPYASMPWVQVVSDATLLQGVLAQVELGAMGELHRLG
jgi:hypothetical protein